MSYEILPTAYTNMVEAQRGIDVPDLLYDLLRLAIPHGLEKHIIDILPFKDRGKIDEFGNFSIKIGKNPTTMFSCHMDTVHRALEEHMKNKTKLKIWLITKGPGTKPQETGFVWGGVKKDPKKTGGKLEWDHIVLGADDKAGVYTLCKMIEAKVPGLYVFHCGEEQGCLGSKWIVQNSPKLVEGIKRCVAFDRKGYTDVIAFQCGNVRCASTEFTTAVADALNDHMLLPTKKYTPDVYGMVTDSAMYREIIPECINLSIGYDNQHTERELLDVMWLTTKFIPAAIALDWENLPTVRDPKSKAGIKTVWEADKDKAANDRVYVLPLSPKFVTKGTPFMRVPSWKPAEGLILEASYEGMIEIIYKHLTQVGDKYSLARDIYRLLITEQRYRNWLTDEINKEPNDELNDNIDDVPNKEVLKLIGPLIPLAVAPSQPKLIPGNVTEDGVPKDPVEFRNRTAHKVGLITTIIKNQQAIKMTPGQEQQFIQLKIKFNRIIDELNKTKVGWQVSPKVFGVLGRTLVRFTDIMLKAKLNNTDVISAYAAANKYKQDYWYEPGILTKQ